MRNGLRARRADLWRANSPPAHYTGISGEYFAGKTIRPRGDRNIANRCLGLVRGRHRHTVPHSDSANPIPGRHACAKVMKRKHLRAIRGLGA